MLQNPSFKLLYAPRPPLILRCPNTLWIAHVLQDPLQYPRAPRPPQMPRYSKTPYNPHGLQDPLECPGAPRPPRVPKTILLA